MKKNEAKIYLGTSGWTNKEWGKKFYPVREKDLLKFYAGWFKTVEINNTFYHTPPVSFFKKWHDDVPADFIFAVKLNRYLTHIERFRGTMGATRYFLTNCLVLAEKLGPILVQLPPNFPYRRERLEKFLKDAAKIETENKVKFRFALEPRHPSWFLPDKVRELKKMLKKHNSVLVFAHSDKYPGYDPEKVKAGKFVYIRLHGPEEFAASLYRASLLRPWAERIKGWNKKGKDVYLYFNNDVHAYAIDDLKTLKKMLQSGNLK